MNSNYFLKIKKIAENKLSCVCALLTKRQHTCDKQKHKIMISYNCLPPRGGGGGHCKPQFYYLHQLNANKRWWNHEKLKQNAPPFSRQSGWVFQFLRDPWVAHTGVRNENFFLSFPPSLAAQLRSVKNSNKICFIGHIKCPV